MITNERLKAILSETQRNPGPGHSLLDAMQLVCLGQSFDDIGHASVEMLLRAVIGRTREKTTALHMVARIMAAMATVIDEEFNTILDELDIPARSN